MKVQHTNTGRVAEVLSQDAKQVRIRFEDGTEQGMIPLTFKRWWKEIESDVEEKLVSMPGAEKLAELKDEDKAGDGTPLAEVGKEILEQAKEKAKQLKDKKTQTKSSTSKKSTTTSKKSIEKKNNVENVEKIVAFFDDYAKKHKDDIYRANGMKMIVYKLKNGKGYARIDFTKSCVWFGANSKALENVKVTTPNKVRKHTFDYAWSISDLNDKTKKFIVDILDKSREYQINKKDKTKKSKKEEK